MNKFKFFMNQLPNVFKTKSNKDENNEKSLRIAFHDFLYQNIQDIRDKFD